MYSTRAATILAVLALTALPMFAVTQQKSPNDSEPATSAEARQSSATVSRKTTQRGKTHTSKHSAALRSLDAEYPPSPVSVVSAPAEYLSGEARVQVKGNENPIVRLGLAQSGVTLVEFPASDRFFALHPGNSEMVTIDESPTKQNDHFFVFRAGSSFVPPSPERSADQTGPSASIIAQMRSGMVVTFLIYTVGELNQMAHRVVILYDRAEVVAARRAAGLAVNLEEKEQERQERSIRIAPETDRPGTTTESRSSDANPELRPRTVDSSRLTDKADDNNSIIKASSSDGSERSASTNSGPKPDRDFAAEARKALKLAITSSKSKKWTRPAHGLSIATSIPKDSGWSRAFARVGSAAVNVAGAIAGSRISGQPVIVTDIGSRTISPFSSEVDSTLLQQARGFVEVPAGAAGFVMITTLPADAEGVDAEPDHLAQAPDTIATNGNGAGALTQDELSDLLTIGDTTRIREALPRMSPQMRRIAEIVLAESSQKNLERE